ncbi:MAG: group III truncated hemoglobin [Rhizobiaceae bacterium]
MTGTAQDHTRPPRGGLPAITPDDISKLVNDFYADIRIHPRLGPIFNTRLDGKWPAHLDKLKAFWRSVLLTSGEYYGRPVPAHNGIAELQDNDFALWLGLFDKHIDQIFEPEAQIMIKEKARRIAKSLWFSRFGTPSNTPPKW